MINNRQGGRRRGRGGSSGGPPRSNNPGPGNRQDNRQRGNAAQLLEKYKGLARDAQMQGDRVLTETYLQYADHYFRTLNETRSRYEEQRPRRDDYADEDEGEAIPEVVETRPAAPVVVSQYPPVRAAAIMARPTAGPSAKPCATRLRIFFRRAACTIPTSRATSSPCLKCGCRPTSSLRPSM